MICTLLFCQCQSCAKFILNQSAILKVVNIYKTRTTSYFSNTYRCILPIYDKIKNAINSEGQNSNSAAEFLEDKYL